MKRSVEELESLVVELSDALRPWAMYAREHYPNAKEDDHTEVMPDIYISDFARAVRLVPLPTRTPA
jgi:hypothetical protein